MFGGQYGVDQLRKFVDLAGELMNVGEALLNKGGLFQLFRLTDEASAMSSVDMDLVKKQYREMDEEDRGVLLSALKSKLDLDNDILEKKIEDGADLVEDALVLGVQAYNDAVDYYGKVKAMAVRAEEILG